MDARPARINVGQLPQGRFMAHGELQVWHHGRLLCYEAGGPFNVEMVDVMSRAVGRLLQSWQPTAPYVCVTWWHGSLLASPEVLEVYHDLLRLGRQGQAGQVHEGGPFGRVEGQGQPFAALHVHPQAGGPPQRLEEFP